MIIHFFPFFKTFCHNSISICNLFDINQKIKSILCKKINKMYIFSRHYKPRVESYLYTPSWLLISFKLLNIEVQLYWLYATFYINNRFKKNALFEEIQIINVNSLPGLKYLRWFFFFNFKCSLRELSIFKRLFGFNFSSWTYRMTSESFSPNFCQQVIRFEYKNF